MALMKKSVPGPSMTRIEIICGIVYLPIYMIGLSFVLELVFGLLKVKPAEVTANLWYFALNFLFLALLFRRWLLASVPTGRWKFWPFLQAVILGFVLYYALTWLLGMIYQLTGIVPPSPNDNYLGGLAKTQFTTMAISIVILAPFAEEILFRGVIFGNLRRLSPLAAYLVSVIVFAVIHVVAYIPQIGWQAALLASIGYLPGGIALAWTYSKADSIWASMILHAILNGMGLGLLQLEGLG